MDQSPVAGFRAAKNSTVEITVSNGKPKVEVPDVMGKDATDAESALRDAGLVPKIFSVHSGKPPNTVTGQDPPAGTMVVQGSRVRINVSSGPTPVSVPYVVGLTFSARERAAAERGLRRQASERRQQRTQGPGRRAGSERLGRTELHDHSQRLERAAQLDRPGRDEPGPGLGDLDPPERRLQGARRRRRT